MLITGTTGVIADVNAQKRLLTESNAHTPISVAADLQNAYTITIAADPNGADQDFFYLKNTSAKLLKIPRVSIWLDAAVTAVLEVTIKTGVTGSPTSGTAIVPVSLYTGGPAADVTCEFRDEDLALVGGTGVVTMRVDKTAGTGEQHWDFLGPIILPRDTALVFNNDIDPVGQDIDMTVWFYFE